MRKTLESPIVSYLIIGTFSLFAAGIMFLIGGSFAQVSNQAGNFLGFTFQAGGAFAGFVLVFWLSLKTVERLRQSVPATPEPLVLKVPVNDKLPLIDNRSCFTRGRAYRCTYIVLDMESGESREDEARYTWENGHLTLYVPGAAPGDMIQVRVRDGQSSWESEHFDWRTQGILVNPVLPHEPAS